MESDINPSAQPMSKTDELAFAGVVKRTIYKVVDDSAMLWTHAMEADANNRILEAHRAAVATHDQQRKASLLEATEGLSGYEEDDIMYVLLDDVRAAIERIYGEGEKRGLESIEPEHGVDTTQ